MRRVLPILAAAGFIFLAAQAANAQEKKQPGKYDPPGSVQPSAEMLKQIEVKTAQLAEKIAELRKDKRNDALLPDLEIYLRAAQNIVRFKEFYNKNSGQWTLDALQHGLERYAEFARVKPSWTTGSGQTIVRGYRSRIDGTAQPYAVTYPRDYGKDPKKSWRVDVVLHGRNATLTEVGFINTHHGKRAVPAEQDYVQIDVFGRGNNAYRWAGEIDVLDVTDTVTQRDPRGQLDLLIHRPVVLRGFSMGGAGTWHIGLHFPSFYRVLGPGAGFTTTHGYAGGLPEVLPDYQEKCLRIYDAVDYAENAVTVPIVAYSGSNDPQKLAADIMEKRLKELNINTMTHVIAPGLGHSFPPEWFKKVNALYSEHVAKGRPENPDKVSFVTYTTKYNRCDWLSITRLEKHYDKASVHAERTDKGYKIATKNVRRLTIDQLQKGAEFSVVIDGQQLQAAPAEDQSFIFRRQLVLAKSMGQWKALKEFHDMPSKPEKMPGQQGPIDDAFTRDFVCVTGSGETWHPATKKHIDAKLEAFRHDWAKHWRGELPITTDAALTEDDIGSKNLILFGDPNSNKVLAKILPELPLKWTKDEIEFAGKKYKSSEHVPVMIFPNPLGADHLSNGVVLRRLNYIVLNTGHTIPSEDYNKTNAMLFARLGDYAVLRMTPTARNPAAYEVATAGLFDEFWQVEKK